ncbi:hypothetical protein [Saccharopolyspora hattusasensis]|uniref:hypothetical protein n=1 Tax=Saccharopolyspora hattusasensis TaxID=1128679 RepID=UPI003D989EF1
MAGRGAFGGLDGTAKTNLTTCYLIVPGDTASVTFKHMPLAITGWRTRGQKMQTPLRHGRHGLGALGPDGIRPVGCERACRRDSEEIPYPDRDQRPPSDTADPAMSDAEYEDAAPFAAIPAKRPGGVRQP